MANTFYTSLGYLLSITLLLTAINLTTDNISMADDLLCVYKHCNDKRLITQEGQYSLPDLRSKISQLQNEIDAVELQLSSLIADARLAEKDLDSKIDTYEELAYREVLYEVFGNDFTSNYLDIVSKGNTNNLFKYEELVNAKEKINSNNTMHQIHRPVLAAIKIDIDRQNKILQEIDSSYLTERDLYRKYYRKEINAEELRDRQQELTHDAIIKEHLTPTEFKEYNNTKVSVAVSQMKNKMTNRIKLFEPSLPDEVAKIATNAYYNSETGGDGNTSNMEARTNNRMIRISSTLKNLKAELEPKDYRVLEKYFELQEENALSIDSVYKGL